MRILKRNLAFVLVMAMAIGMMVSANAANVEDYRDANDIKFTEAVDVLTALGVLEGEDGTFHPERVLTREEGAKIITYLMLGDDAADSLNTSVAPFADVAAGRWSSGYIAYCVSQGIVGGYGNGNFGPTDTLTGTQFAKMLLVALGYGVNGEFTGANWEIETNKRALLAGVYEGNLGVNFSNGVKREEAAQYAFNTLANCATVSYSDLTGAYYTVNVLNSDIKLYYEAGDTNKEKAINTLGWQLYNLSKKKSNADEFGRDCHSWKQNAKTLTESYHDEADAVYTSSVKASKIYADLGLTDTTVTADVYIDSAESNTTFALTKNGKTETKEIADAGIGNGVIVEAYADTTGNDEAVKLVVIHTYLGEVADYDADKGEVTIDGEDAFETAVEYEKEDLVMYTKADDKVQSVKPAKTVEGKVTAVASNYVRFDGDRYDYAQVSENLAGKLTFNGLDAVDFDNTYALVVDDYGYAVEVKLIEEEAEEVGSYLYVSKTQGRESDLLNGKAAVAEVRYLDGSGKETVTLETATKKIKDGVENKEGTNTLCYKTVKMVDDKATTVWVPVSELSESDGSAKAVGAFFGYSVNDDGEYTLKDLDVTKTKVIGAKDTLSTFDGKVTSHSLIQVTPEPDPADDTVDFTINSKTVAKVIDDDNKVTTYTGYKNIKVETEKDVNVLLVFDAKADKLVKEMYVLGEAVSESDTVFAYWNGVAADIAGDKKSVTLFMDDGTTKEDVTVNGDLPAEAGIYAVTFNSKDEVKLEEADSTKYDVVGTAVELSNVTSSFMVENGNEHNFAEEYKSFKLKSEDDVFTSFAPSSVKKGNMVIYVADHKTHEVKLVFITADKAAD